MFLKYSLRYKHKTFRLFSELRLKTEGVSQKAAKVAKVWR